jgi:NAD(P)-dependent dehydrogenase (short-subunit alcohol dehydrogenase family)
LTVQNIPRRFDGRRAVVTGAGSGIGRATATRLAAEGARVGLVDRSRQSIDGVVAEIAEAGGAGVPVAADCSVEEEIEAALDVAAHEFGGIDLFVANAGVERADLDDRADRLSLPGWDAHIGNNLTGQFLSCKHALRHLQTSGGGTVVCLGSNVGHLGMATNQPAYSASKGGIFALMKVMAIDFARHNIRVNMVIPGFIDTPMNEHVMGDPEQLRYWSDQVPLGRAGRADEVAAAILWLSSEDSSYCVGTALVVDGGQSSI